MVSKKIVIVHKTCVADYPPLLTLIRDLSLKGYSIHLIVGFEEEELLKELQTLCIIVHCPFITPSKNKLFYWYKIRKTFWKIIEENNYGEHLLWLPSADTTLSLGRKLLNYNYVLNLYELFDYEPMYLSRLKKYALNASLVICSNLERSSILRVWWNLKNTPEVILNKPRYDIEGKKLYIPEDLSSLIHPLDGTFKILYQGIISEERSLVTLAEIVRFRPEFSLIIMGKRTKYLDKLLKINPKIVHIPFVSPPFHLHITSHADVGVLSYDYSSLNNIFCAPNKLWEFSNFALPMLGNDIPGLYNTIESNQMGTCADFDNRSEVETALNKIIDNIKFYQLNSRKFYDSYNYSFEVDRILSKINFEIND